ncbi:SCP-like protein [Necator americanus]|uniref:SCP-like protein n=1 Tax=Necator americanus TaxID=51031 RepID=W2TYV1_NECAM|nr:SCP-like protein [Necator americanus]ETN86236.1 SCP-like protein [Necator americanus]
MKNVVDIGRFQLIGNCQSPQPHASDIVRNAFLKMHNELRRELAKGNLDAQKDKFRGSANLFAMNYDCDLENAARTVARECPDKAFSTDGRFVNYKLIRGNSPSDQDAKNDIEGPVYEDWSYTRFDGNLDQETASYDDEEMEAFANMVYNKSISLGCVATYCSLTRRRAYACVYSSSPELGQPLYWPDSKTNGCTKNSQCRKAIKGSTCINDTTNTDTLPEGLCQTKELAVPETTNLQIPLE